MKLAKTSGVVLVAMLLLWVAPITWGRTAIIPALQQLERAEETASRSASADLPAYCLTAHRVGNIQLAVTNNGTVGVNFIPAAGSADCFTGEPIGQSVQFPSGNRNSYFYGGAFWIGAVIGSDTLVSVGHTGWAGSSNEFNPDVSPIGDMIRRSILDTTGPLFDGAVSHEDYIAVYTDTIQEGVHYQADWCGRPPCDSLLHSPLNIEVTQRSYAWSYALIEDFVLFDMDIKNIGGQALNEVYMGFYVDGDVHNPGSGNGDVDDLTGFIRSAPVPYLPAECGFYDDLSLAWIADNDGDLSIPEASKRVPHVTGTRILRTPADQPNAVSYNWWVSGQNDWGPRHRDDLRDLGTGGEGTPSGDANKYHYLRNGEVDYDQAYTATIGAFDTLWKFPPEEISSQLSTGVDTRYLLSFGPFTLQPGETAPVSFAYMGGMNLHVDEDNYLNLLHNDPDTYYDGLDFSDIITNALWADWVYDNPGVDTDGDGDSGLVHICCQPDSSVCDTIWYKGDGVPDFRPPFVLSLSGTVFRFVPDSTDYSEWDEYAQAWREPVPDYPVRLYDTDSTTVIAEVQTDRRGRYWFEQMTGTAFCLGVDYADAHCLYQFDADTPGAIVDNLHIDLSGIPTDVDDLPGERPLSFGLTQNYPNPFNPTTTISYNLATRSLVELSVYNMLGQKVTTLTNDVQAAGEHRAIWDGTNRSGNRVASGIYFYRLDACEQSVVKKMVLLK